MKCLLTFLIFLTFHPFAHAQEAISIEGLWEVPQDGTLVQIIVNDGIADGFIYQRPDGRTDEVDKFNPRPDFRHKPIIGLRVLENLKKDGDEWNGGKVYDPDSGSTYHAYASLEDPDRLRVRGFILIPLLGRTIRLKRVADATPPTLVQ